MKMVKLEDLAKARLLTIYGHLMTHGNIPMNDPTSERRTRYIELIWWLGRIAKLLPQKYTPDWEFNDLFYKVVEWKRNGRI